MERLRDFIIATLADHVTTTIEAAERNASTTDGLAGNREREDVESPDLPDAASIFLLHTRALDHVTRVDDTFIAFYCWLASRMDEPQRREFAEEYSIITRITRATGDREEFYAALQAFVDARRLVESATELHDEKQTIDTQRALNLKKLELKTARAQLHTWAELFVITLEERTSNVRFLFEVYLLIGHSSSRGCETWRILGG